MSLLLNLARHARWVLLAALLTSLVSGFGSAGLVALINQALGASNAHLAELGWRFLLLAIVVLITRTLSQTLFMYLGQRAKAMLRMRTIRRIGEASFRNLEQQGASRSLAVLTQDLDMIVMFFVSLPALTMQSAVILGCLAYLGFLSWQILLLALLTIAVGAAGFRLANGRALFHLRASRKREDDLIRHFRALFDGAKELKLHRERREAFIDDTLAPHVEAVRVQRTRGYVLYAAAASWGSFVLFAFIGVTLFVVARAFPIETHVMSGYALIFLYMIMPIEALLSAIPSIGTARVALERIEQVNADLPAEQSAAAHKAKPFESLVLEGLTHRYFREKENEIFTLGPVSLRLEPGELVFLIGGNGSGKTTLAKMIVGLYTPESGRIVLNGAPVDESGRDAYRQNFSVVFNDFYLFDTLLGLKLDGIDERAGTWLRHLQLDHKVSVTHGAFSTLELSQGQRKRLALLVAYLEDRPLYVFDEWAADQDPLFKDLFYTRLLPELKARGKTVIVITHDDRYFHLADRYIKLEYGQVAETGTGADLRTARDWPLSGTHG
jgi:putative pyoverdin transport system ATP-binding/permease protein